MVRTRIHLEHQRQSSSVYMKPGGLLSNTDFCRGSRLDKMADQKNGLSRSRATPWIQKYRRISFNASFRIFFILRTWPSNPAKKWNTPSHMLCSWQFRATIYSPVLLCGTRSPPIYLILYWHRITTASYPVLHIYRLQDARSRARGSRSRCCSTCFRDCGGLHPMLCPGVSYQVLWLRWLVDGGNAGKISMHENSGELSDRVQVLYSIYTIFVTIGVHYGIGQHTSDLTASNFSKAMKVSSHTCFCRN